MEIYFIILQIFWSSLICSFEVVVHSYYNLVICHYLGKSLKLTATFYYVKFLGPD